MDIAKEKDGTLSFWLERKEIDQLHELYPNMENGIPEWYKFLKGNFEVRFTQDLGVYYETMNMIKLKKIDPDK